MITLAVLVFPSAFEGNTIDGDQAKSRHYVRLEFEWHKSSDENLVKRTETVRGDASNKKAPENYRVFWSS